nr:putative ribonuclease H-like domain-containing protein [Tanacetum cinerariifolium]
MKIDLNDKTDVLAYHQKLLAESLKENEDLKTKFKNWQNSSKNLSRLLNTQMSANDKFWRGCGDYRYGSILSYENEVLESVFMNKVNDLEDTPVNDRYANEMHAVPPHMIGNYMLSRPDVEIDYSKFTYGIKQTSANESNSKPSEYTSCKSDSSVETSTSMPELVEKCIKGNKAHLADYQEFKGGSVAFGGSNGRIDGKGKIKTGKLDFKDVYYVEELKHYNLFYVSQEQQVLLKIPRQHNMYSFNLKKIDPSVNLACLFAKALIDESNKWHRRRGHVNFKNLNKLVKGNLVRALPSKIFENDHTCVACQKGKQHKASYKGKTASYAEAVNTACYVLNRVLVTKPQNKTPYELLTGKQPIISYLRPFRCHVTILNTIDQMGKFDGKSDSGFLVGYSLNSKAYRVYNLETKRVEENLHGNFLENKPNVAGKGHAWMFDLDYLTNFINYEPVLVENQANKYVCPKEANNSAGDKLEKNTDFKTCVKQNASTSSTNPINTVSTPLSTVGPSRAFNDGELSYLDPSKYALLDDPLMPHLEDIYASPSEGILLIHLMTMKISHALEDKSWVDAMQEELLQFQIQKVWILVDLPFKKKAIGTKWVYRNKKDERGVVVRNKARLVTQGHRQEAGIDYDEVFAPVVRIEAIRIFLAFVSYMGFIVYQIDVKSAFLYGIIDEEVYVSQPPGFVDLKFPNKVYKVVKSLYSLHQALRAWYATLSTFFEKSGYRKGKSWCDEFEELMKNRFQISSMGELTFFLGLQVKQKEDGIFISQDKYVAEIMKKFDFLTVKTVSTPIETQKPLVKYEEAADVDVRLYRSMIGSLMYLTASRPDIMFPVCACSRFQVTPKTSHLQAVKRIFRYLKGQPKLGLWYPKVSSFNPKSYSNSDYASANLDRKSTTRGKITPLFPSMLTQAAVAEGEDSETPTETQPTPSPTQPSVGDQPPLTESSLRHDYFQDPRVDLEGIGGSGGDRVNLPHDSPLSGGQTSDRAKGSLNLEALSALCTNLSKMVLALEIVKVAQAKEILTMKARTNKLEKRCKPSISHHRAWLMSVSLLSKKKKLSKMKSVSKQGRKNAKSGPTKDDSDKLDAELDEDMEYIDTEEAVNEGRQSTIDTARPDVSTVRQELSTVGPTTTPTTTTIFDDEEMTLADTLIKLKDGKAKGVAFKDSKSTDRPAISILTLKPLPTIDPKDKRKGVLEEPESAKKMTKSNFDAAPIARDEEIARQLEVELKAEVERERQIEEQASMNYIANLYDEVQARIDDDHELVVRWTHEEHEKFTHSQLNKKSFEDIQVLYMKEHELIVDFVPIGFEEDERRIKDMNKKNEEESSDKGVDITKKRKAGSRMKKMSKRQKTDVDLEEEEKLNVFLKIDSDEEGIIDYEVLDKRFPIINWESKFYHYDRHRVEGIYYRIFRSDGSSRWIKTFFEMVTSKELASPKQTALDTMADMNIPTNDAPAEQAPANSQSNPIFPIVVALLKNTNLFKAFTASSMISAIYIQQLWDTMCFNTSTGYWDTSCQLDEQWFNLHKDLLRYALDITPTNDNNPFMAPPSSDTVIEYLNPLGYPKKSVGYDKPRHPVLQILNNLATASLEKKKTAHLLIPSVRYVGKDGREIFGMLIPDALLTNESKGAPYYSEYQEHVAKYQQHMDVEHGKAAEGGATKSSKATKVTKPKVAKATKPASDPKPKPEPSQPPKAVPKKTKTVRSVVIREPDSGRIQPLPKVKGKGKEKRRTPMPVEAFGPTKYPSLDTELALTDSETASDDEVPKINTGDQDEGQARPNPSIQDEVKAGPNPGVQDESQAGSNPGDAAESQPLLSHVVHDGPNLEPMDLETTDASTP